MTTPGRMLPVPTPDSEEFWRGCAKGILRMQRCDECTEINWFPRGICVNCSSTHMTWIDLSGRGTVYSFSVVTRPPNDSYPREYILALVDLLEGPRVTTHIVDVDPARVTIGMPVTVRFERQNEEISLAVFVPVENGGATW
jgi:uncharacterized protein